VAHAYNPSYLGGRDQEEQSSKPAWANSLPDPILKVPNPSQAPVTHACNPSYSGDREQEDRGSKPAQANSSRDPILKKKITEKV
jgi:hypothetical protein